MTKAKALTVEQLGPYQYKVGDYYVDLWEDIKCYCKDSEFRGHKPGHMCKHERAARDFAAKHT